MDALDNPELERRQALKRDLGETAILFTMLMALMAYGLLFTLLG